MAQTLENIVEQLAEQILRGAELMRDMAVGLKELNDRIRKLEDAQNAPTSTD